ncbi:hypothetical protein K439DRAFT_1362266 [Ramaria rubella]|nr:hypothetical protein K439DRAFT_1362266 [Ramaria rubella]
MTSRPSLPSVLSSYPAIQDVDTTLEQTNSTLGRITSPEETAIFICVYDKCYRLFPSRDKLLVHKKRDHGSDDTQGDILTWND